MSGEGAAKRQPGALEGPRPPRLDERDALLDVINSIFRTSRGRAPTVGRDWAHVYTPDNLPNVSVIFDAGKPVASTGVWANDVMVGDVQVRVGGINTVGTLPDYRGRGLGSQVVLAAHQTMRDLGCQVGLLSTGIADWYRRLGWEEAGVMRGYGLDRASAGGCPLWPRANRCAWLIGRRKRACWTNCWTSTRVRAWAGGAALRCWPIY